MDDIVFVKTIIDGNLWAAKHYKCTNGRIISISELEYDTEMFNIEFWGKYLKHLHST